MAPAVPTGTAPNSQKRGKDEVDRAALTSLPSQIGPELLLGARKGSGRTPLKGSLGEGLAERFWALGASDNGGWPGLVGRPDGRCLGGPGRF